MDLNSGEGREGKLTLEMERVELGWKTLEMRGKLKNGRAQSREG